MFLTIFCLSLRDALMGKSFEKASLGAPATVGEFLSLSDGLYRVTGLLHQDLGSGSTPWAFVVKVPTPDTSKAAHE